MFAMFPARWGALLSAALLAACSGGASDAPATIGQVELRWTPSRASGVNAAGGGYRVYWSTTSGFAPGDPGVQSLDVPWPGSGQTPATASLTLSSGNYYFKVVAYAATGGGIESAPSAEVALAVR